MEYSPEQYKSMSMAEWQKEIMEKGTPKELNISKYAPVRAELEGGGTTWWYVCEECRSVLHKGDKYCHECGRKVDWT